MWLESYVKSCWISLERVPDFDRVAPRTEARRGVGPDVDGLARIVASLEMKLDVDPFAEDVAITSIRTVGDLCNAYEKATRGAA